MTQKGRKKLWYANREQWNSYMRTWMRKWRKQNPERDRENSLRSRRRQKQRRFGVRYPARVKCNLCKKDLEGTEITLDHDHSSGTFRGWLCRLCNSRLGWLEANKSRILSYLENPSDSR